MKIGELRHRVIVQMPVTTQTTRGAETLTWQDSSLLAAEIRTLTGNEREGNDQVIPVALHSVTLRWPMPTGVELTTKCRVKWGDRYFGIVHVGEPDNRMRLVVLSCSELVGDDRVL